MSYSISILDEGPIVDWPDCLRRIADLIEQGNTSGYGPGWELVEVKDGE